MNSEYIQASCYETTKFDDEWIILNLDNFTITKLNDVGGYCWSLLRDRQTISTIKKGLAVKYGGGNEVDENTLENFLNNLIECGLVKYVG